jgi:hypothetical protein
MVSNTISQGSNPWRCVIIIKGGEMMDNKRMIEIAIETLSSFDTKNIENIEMERTQYTDGSAGYTVKIIFFAEESGEE